MSFLKSIFRRWRSHRNQNNPYQPVSNWADVGSDGSNNNDHDDDIDDMDELMRMASEADTMIQFQEGELNLDEGAVFSSSASSSSHWLHTPRQRVRLCRLMCECGLPTVGEKVCPWLLLLSLFTILSVTGVSVALGYYSLLVLKPEPIIDKSIDAFSIPNHQAYVHFDALNLARRYNSSRMRFRREAAGPEPAEWGSQVPGFLGESGGARAKRSANLHVERFTYQVVKRWKMQVIYLAVGDQSHNVFTEERLKTIHKVERDIVTHPRWKQFCLRDPRTASFDPAVRDHNACAPLNSLLSYFFPSTDDSGKVFYDGFGDNLGDIESALHLAMNHESFYYFVDKKINKTFQKSHMMRTEVLFGAPLPGFQSLGDHSEAQSDKFKEFVITYIDLLSKASTDKVHVLYGGNELFDYEVESTFWSDVKMAIIAASCIAVLMFIMTSFSISLTFCGLLCIALSFPLAMFFYRVVFNIVGLGIMNGAAAFVIIGIGVDDVFVFINIFRQSNHQKSVTNRLMYTCRTAGVATFFTSFTTAIAFASNMTSSIPAVYTFGLFMSLIVASCWITVFLVMPASLYLYAFWFEPLEKMCGGICSHCRSRSVTDSGVSQQGALQSSLVNASSPAMAIDDDDVPLLHMEQDMTENEDDVPMLVPDQSSSAGSSDSALPMSSSFMGRAQQYVLGAFVTHIVIRFRKSCLILYVLVFVASVGMMTQLRPSPHPPQLFLPNTNLQRLLDLKANFSMIDTLRCDWCSALYNVGSEDSHQATQRPQLTPPAPVQAYRPTLTPNTTTLAALTTAGPRKTTGWNRSTATSLPLPSTTTTTTTTTSTTTTTTTTAPATKRPAVINPTELTPHDANPPAGQNPEQGSKSKSVGVGYNPCKHQSCDNIKNRPILQSDATVYVVFGITGVNRDGVPLGHVLNEYKGKATFDSRFADEVGDLGNLNVDHLRELCQVCHALANNEDLVKTGSAQCLPSHLPHAMSHLLNGISECRNLPKTLTIYNHEAPSHAEASVNSEGKIIWLAFAFESTVSKGESYFEAYKKYLAWEAFIAHIKTNVLSKDSPLQSVYQTSEFWKKVLMEVVAVNSAVYSVVLSLVVCMFSVAIFTGHFLMLLIITLTIIALISLVVAIFFMAGWHMGAVEAVSLSILVGSSVDYCVHLVEGYLLVGQALPPHLAAAKDSEVRSWRTRCAVQHIGASIISSAMTTIVAAVPLTQTTIQPFSKFGQIVLINSSVAILYTLTLCVAMLACLAPPRFLPSWRSRLKGLGASVVVAGAVMLGLYVASVSGAFIPGPNGGSLFGG